MRLIDPVRLRADGLATTTESGDVMVTNAELRAAAERVRKLKSLADLSPHETAKAVYGTTDEAVAMDLASADILTMVDGILSTVHPDDDE